MKRLLLVSALGLSAVALAAPARAQFPGWNGRQAAYDNGYREGSKEGNKDARKGEYFSYQDEKSFQRADKGYHRTFGDRERYRQVFRNGYAAGYSDGYQRIAGNYGSYGRGRGRAVPRRPYPDVDDRYPNTYPNRYPNRYPNTYPNTYPNRYPDAYPGGYGYYSPAFDNGRNDGYEKGMEDFRKNRSFDPLRHKWYRSGDHDYRGEYGSREQYRDIYRRGFQEGYDQGYRQGRYGY